MLSQANSGLLRACLVGVAALIATVVATGSALAVSGRIKTACQSDYFRHCSAHAVGSAALRQCMQNVGPGLSSPCIVALVEEGEISQADIARIQASINAEDRADKPDAGQSKAADKPARSKAAETPDPSVNKTSKNASAAKSGKAGAAVKSSKVASVDKSAADGKTAKKASADKTAKAGAAKSSKVASVHKATAGGKTAKKASVAKTAGSGRTAKVADAETTASKGTTAKSAKSKKVVGPMSADAR